VAGVFDTEFVRFLATLGVGGVLAGVIFAFYRKDIRQFTDLWKMQSEVLIVVVKENTTSNTQLVEMIRSLHKRMDKMTAVEDHALQAAVECANFVERARPDYEAREKRG
jgi:predicted RND superfamily exporter protein